MFRLRWSICSSWSSTISCSCSIVPRQLRAWLRLLPGSCELDAAYSWAAASLTPPVTRQLWAWLRLFPGSCELDSACSQAAAILMPPIHGQLRAWHSPSSLGVTTPVNANFVICLHKPHYFCNFDCSRFQVSHFACAFSIVLNCTCHIENS